jgi:hypothetical protein
MDFGAKMSDLPARDFSVLCAVHEFFLKILSQQLHHEVPLPAGLQLTASQTPDLPTVETLRHWVNVLDLAVTPPMFRDELGNGDVATAAALLKYYTHNPEQLATDRDKTDFVVTWLYRHTDEAGKWKAPGAFEKQVTEIIAATVPALPEEHRQLLREFEFIREEIAEVDHFDKLVDSAMVQRVRDIKASFGKSFYHPTVLATVASYNVEFGRKFDELFKEATRQIREFAQSVQQAGGSSATAVEGNVTVKQLEDLEDQKILKTDYREAQEQFRKVSRIKKAVDSKRKRNAAPAAVAAPSTLIRTVAEAKTTGRVAAWPIVEDDRLALMVPNDSVMAAQMEENKLVTLADSIRNFVRAADPARAQVVPLKHGNVILAPHEVEAFRADYFQEKSFRGEFAYTLMKVVACGARIDAQLADFQRTQSSAYLWKPHADSLTTLIKNSQSLTAEANKLNATATQRGLNSKVSGMNQSLAKLQEKVNSVTSVLSQLGSK